MKTITKKCTAKKCACRKTAKKPVKACAKAVKVEKKEVTFTLHAEKGKSVYLAGCFNEWDPTAKKMTYKAASGIYTAKLKLAAGDYQYKFVVDGSWCADPENANCVQNDKGTFNSVISVK